MRRISEPGSLVWLVKRRRFISSSSHPEEHMSSSGEDGALCPMQEGWHHANEAV